MVDRTLSDTLHSRLSLINKLIITDHSFQMESMAEAVSEEVVDLAIEDMNKFLTAIENIINSATEIGQDISELEHLIIEIITKRSQNLLTLLETVDDSSEIIMGKIQNTSKNIERVIERITKSIQLWKHVEAAIVELEKEVNQ